MSCPPQLGYACLDATPGAKEREAASPREIGKILLKRHDVSDDLLTHELCHIWQVQQRPWHTTFKHLTTRYRSNPYELEARRAVVETRS